MLNVVLPHAGGATRRTISCTPGSGVKMADVGSAYLGYEEILGNENNQYKMIGTSLLIILLANEENRCRRIWHSTWWRHYRR